MRKTIFAALVLAGLPAAGWAAPFCVQGQGMTPQCHYVDAVQCRKRAEEIRGLCVANPEELILSRGTGKYCMVDSSKNSMCSYVDRTSCAIDALRNQGVCLENTASTVQPDPYASDPNRKY